MPTRHTTPPKPEAATRPAYIAYHVQEPAEQGGKGRWVELGAFFEHADGKGGTLVLDAMPIQFSGRIVLRVPSPKAE